MSVASRSFIRSTILLLCLGFAALLAVVAASFWLADRTETYAEAVTNVRRVRAAAVDLRGLLQDAETGQRGFLLTGSETYLTPYLAAVAKMPEQIKQLQERAEPFPDLKARLGPLLDIVEQKLAELAETVALAQSGKREEALAVVRTDRGKNLMDQARVIFAGMVGDADELFSQRVETQRENVRALQNVSLAGGGVILLVAGAGAWTVRRYTEELKRAQGAIEALNAGLEERVRERTLNLRRANDEIQRFAYIVTHDLRAPLVNIMGFTAELETSLAALKDYMKDVETTDRSREAKQSVDHDVPEALEFIRASTRKMDGLINAILKLSREGRRPLKAERIDLRNLLQASVDALQHQLAEAQSSVSLDVKAPPVVSDRLTLEQAFSNLMDNAVKYREPGRPLTIAVRVLPEKGDWVRIDFTDNGRGIAASDHERVFELFRRSGKQDKAGEGIGLAHVRSGIRNLGGDITVASELGKGTTFTISLPRDLEAVLRAQQAA